MIPDGTHTAVVDRIEDGVATLEVAAADELYDLVVDPADLPREARHADAVLTINIEDGMLATASYRPEETDQRATDSQKRFDRLSRRPPDDDS